MSDAVRRWYLEASKEAAKGDVVCAPRLSAAMHAPEAEMVHLELCPKPLSCCAVCM